MKRLIGINKINKIREKYKKSLIKSYVGELIPDFRTQNRSGFDVDLNSDYLKENSDIPKLLNIVNKYCPVAHVGNIYDMGTRMEIDFGGITLHIELRENKIISTRISRVFGSHRNSINIVYNGNDIEKVFKDKIVRNYTEYAILSKELLEQYDSLLSRSK